MPEFPMRLRYVWDSERCGYYGCVYCVLTGMYIHVTRMFMTRKEARAAVEAWILSRPKIGAL